MNCQLICRAHLILSVQKTQLSTQEQERQFIVESNLGDHGLGTQIGVTPDSMF